MENTFRIDGTILAIDKTRPSKEGSTFMLRDFYLDKPMMGDACTIKFQLKGNNTSKIDNFLPGDEIVVDFALLGTAKPKADKVACDTNPNKIDGFSPNVTAFRIEFAQGFVRKNNQPNYNTNNQNNTQQNNQNNNQQEEPWTKDARYNTINASTGKIYTKDEIIDDLPF